MAKMWQPQPWDVIEQWLKAITDEALDDLNSWETDFINDMTIRVQNRWQLSEAQEKKLEAIYAEKTA